MLNKQLTVRLRSVEDNLQTDESDWECIMDSEDIKLEVFVQKDIFLVFLVSLRDPVGVFYSRKLQKKQKP